MHVKPIIKPPVSETFFYGKIISWKFSDSVTYVKARKKYCFRFEIVFESGKVCPMQRGGFVSKTEAIKAIENTIKQLHEKTFVPFEYTAREFFDYWLYYYMIDEADIAYNTYTAYRNIIYNYFLVVWGDKKITAIQRDDLIAALDSIPYDSILRSAYGVIGGSFQYALENHIIYLNPVKSAIKVKRKTEKKCEIENNKKAEHVDQPPVLPAVYALQQVTIMLYLCKQEEPKIFIALLLALTAGLRISEIIAIKYEDIDFGNHEIYIERQLGRSTKNEGLEDNCLLSFSLSELRHWYPVASW